MTEQEKFEALLTDYLDGTLNEADRAKVERRMAEDPELASELAEVRQTMDLLSALPRIDPPVDLVSNILSVTCERVTFWSRVKEWVRFERQAPWAAIAAGAIACMVLIVVLTVPQFDSRQPMFPSEQVAFTGQPEKAPARDDSTGRLEKGGAPLSIEEEAPSADLPTGRIEAPKALPMAGAGGGKALSPTTPSAAAPTKTVALGDLPSADAGGGRDGGTDDSFRSADRDKGVLLGGAMKAAEAPAAPDTENKVTLEEESPKRKTADRNRVEENATESTRESRIDALAETAKKEDAGGPFFKARTRSAAPHPISGFFNQEPSSPASGEPGLVGVTPIAAGRGISSTKGMDYDLGPELEVAEERASKDEGERAKSTPLPIRERFEGAYSGVTQFSTAKVFSLSQWQSLWGRVFSIVDDPKPAPDVDFTRQVVLGIFLGTKSSGGHAVAIQRVEWVDGRIVVTARVTRPKPGQVLTMALSQPYSMVIVDQADGLAITSSTPLDFVYE